MPVMPRLLKRCRERLCPTFFYHKLSSCCTFALPCVLLNSIYIKEKCPLAKQAGSVRFCVIWTDGVLEPVQRLLEDVSFHFKNSSHQNTVEVEQRSHVQENHPVVIWGITSSLIVVNLTRRRSEKVIRHR